MRLFGLRDQEIEIRSVHSIFHEWSGAANQSLARQIAFQVQFSEFFKHLIDNLESVPIENPTLRPMPLSLSLRAGATRTYVLLIVSICEAALAALGEERGLGRRESELYGKPFGALLDIWAPQGVPPSEIESIWSDLQTLKEIRNFVHLPRASENESAYWAEINASESEIFSACDRVLDHLVHMSHIFRDPS